MIRRFKTFLKGHTVILDTLAFLYSLPVIIRHIGLFATGRVSARGAFLKNVRLSIQDKSGHITIGRRARIRDGSICLFNRYNQIVIGG